MSARLHPTCAISPRERKEEKLQNEGQNGSHERTSENMSDEAFRGGHLAIAHTSRSYATTDGVMGSEKEKL